MSVLCCLSLFFFFSSRRRHTRYWRDWSSDVCSSDLQAIQAELESSDEVSTFIYESRDEAYERFQQQFSQQPELVENTPPDALPESFRVELKNPERYEVIAAAFPNGENGVDQVRDEGDFLDRLFSLLNGARNATIAVAVVQALAALLLIANTIQLAAFNRRNETNIMRLVGASRWYTQLPFILEAAIAGLIGGLLAAGGLVLTKVLFVDRTLEGPIKAGIIPPVEWSAIIGNSLIVTAVGVGGGAARAHPTPRPLLPVGYPPPPPAPPPPT